jgi:signal transduction histidine kinase
MVPIDGNPQGARAVEARDQNALELRALQRVIESGSRALDLDVVLGRCLELARDVAHADAGIIYLRETRRGKYKRAIALGAEQDLAPSEIDPADVERALTDPVVHFDLRERGRSHLNSRAFELGMTWTIMLTLNVDGERVGFVALVARQQPELTPTTMRTLAAIAGFEAVAITSARVHRLVELRARLAGMLRDFGEFALNPDVNLRHLILDTALAITQSDRASLGILLPSPGGPLVRIEHAVGEDVRILGMEMPASEPFIAEVMASAQPTIVEDVSQLDPESWIANAARSQGTASFAVLCMRLHGQPIGNLFTGSGKPRVYEEAEIEALQILASMAAHALERERTQREIESARDRLDAILEHLPLVVAVVARNGELLHLNRAGRRFMEWAGVDTTDWRKGIHEITTLDADGNRIAPEETLVPRAFRGESPPPRELTVVSRDGQRRISVLAVAAPQQGADGQIHSVVSAFQDVSALREMANAKDRFLSIASHELRSPITSLRATLSLWEMDPKVDESPERRSVLMARLQRQVGRLSALVDRLLDTARLGAKEVPLEFAECEITALCRDVVDLTSMTTTTHRFTLLAPQPIHGHWDAARIEQVLTNLINNAIRYSPAGSEITVSVEQQDGCARIAVRDEGIGIEDPQPERLFQPFYRGLNASSRHKGGLGLGLYITSEIVRRHGGRISVESAPQKGSTFIVELPLSPPTS